MGERVAVITGGTRGIGLAAAHALVAEGFTVALTGRRPAEDVREVLEALADGSGESAWYAAGDVGSRSDRADLIAGLRDRFASVHCLVNNAGMAPPRRVDVMESSENDFEIVLRTNLQGAHFLTRDVAAWMLESADDSFRSVVNVTSVSAETVSLNRAEYCLAKAALRMSTQVFAARLAGQVGVYEVAPGVIATDMTAGVKDKYDAAIAEGLIPESRWGRPEDVAAAVAACATHRLPYASGTCIRVDGGLSIPRL